MIEIKKYVTELENEHIVYFAIGKNGKKYPMPDAFKAMYDNEHLAIKEVSVERPELFDQSGPYYIPLRTCND